MFELAMDKVVFPNADITAGGDGSASRCLFNDTRFRARLFTKRAKTYPPSDLAGEEGEGEEESGAPASGGGGQQFQPWPYAVEITQTIASGSAVPECYRTLNGQPGERVDLARTVDVTEGAECACEYLNYGT